ncbi:MAG: penicillin-binding protein, partial [Solirubrobacteraceae bacterium]|nr:penicillin-binding protein [Solirubrobacteraceae bacterium]
MPLAALAGVAFVVGVVFGAMHVPPERQVADRFARAWQRGDYPAMYGLVSEKAKERTNLAAFEQSYRDAALTATTRSLRVGHASGGSGGKASVPVRVSTRIFGTIREKLRLPFEDSADGRRIAWRSYLAFPGLNPGESLSRLTRLGPRGAILAADGTPLAAGPDRSSPLGSVAQEIVGTVDSIPADQRDVYRGLGFPESAQVGTAGLEQILNAQVAGTPGGELTAGSRLIARSTPRPGRAVRSTIDVKLEQSAITALGGSVGGIVLMRPQTGELLAYSGIALDGLQPPGSTFKIITTTAALEANKVKLTDRFPVETAAVLSGVSLSNASGESCGGTFVNSFAESCNSVFAPLGVKVGADRLVVTAERYGFNEAPSVPGAAESTLPPADQTGDDLAVGSTAIGQAKVLATPLQMTSIAATIANGGVRARPTLMRRVRPDAKRVTTPGVAATIRRLMIAVVKSGTGIKAQIPGVRVAGKTGTAELGGPPGANEDPQNSDAWFVAFAPAIRPRVAIGVMLVKAGAGGDYA